MAHFRIDGPVADGRLPAVSVEIAGLLKQHFPIHDLIFETGDASYAVVMPDADVDTALRMVEEFRKKLAALPVEGRTRTLSVGVSSRGGRLVDENVLREEADVALAKASREGGNQVIGFRADAARFREIADGKDVARALRRRAARYIPRALRSSATASSFIVKVCSSAGNAFPCTSADVLLHGVELHRVHVRVHLHELRGEPPEQADHVVQHEHLAVAVQPAADADRRDRQLLRDQRRELPRDGLEDDGEDARLLERKRVVDHLPRLVERLALDLEPAQHARPSAA